METTNNRRVLKSVFRREAERPVMQESPVFRRMEMAASTLGSQEGVNEYLLSQIDPWAGQGAVIPDLDMSASVPKSINVSANYLMPAGGSGAGMFVIPWYSKQNGTIGNIRLYGWDPATSTMNLVKTIQPDQDISLSFALFRFISGGLAIKSATVTGSTFTVAGSVEAISYQDPPDFREITYSNLLSQTRRPADAQASIPIQDGIVVISHPQGDPKFHSMETNSVVTTPSKYVVVSYEYTPPATTANAGWAFTSQSAQTLPCFDAQAAATAGNPFLPPGLFGKTKINVQLLISAPVATGAILSIVVTYVFADPATFAQTTASKQWMSAKQLGSNQSDTVTIEAWSDDDREISNIQVFLSSNSANAVANGVSAGKYAAWIRMENYNTPDSGNVGPGSIIAFQAVGAGQQIAINGVVNYEAIPNATLTQNMPTSYTSIENPMDLKVAELVIGDLDQFGVRFSYPQREYDVLHDSGHFRNIATRERSVMHAAGLLSGLRWITNAMKPVVRELAPIAGRSLGAAMGSPGLGGMAGDFVSNMLTTGAPRRKMNCAGGDQDEKEKGGEPSELERYKLKYPNAHYNTVREYEICEDLMSDVRAALMRLPSEKHDLLRQVCDAIPKQYLPGRKQVEIGGVEKNFVMNRESFVDMLVSVSNNEEYVGSDGNLKQHAILGSECGCHEHSATCKQDFEEPQPAQQASANAARDHSATIVVDDVLEGDKKVGVSVRVTWLFPFEMFIPKGNKPDGLEVCVLDKIITVLLNAAFAAVIEMTTVQKPPDAEMDQRLTYAFQRSALGHYKIPLILVKGVKLSHPEHGSFSRRHMDCAGVGEKELELIEQSVRLPIWITRSLYNKANFPEAVPISEIPNAASYRKDSSFNDRTQDMLRGLSTEYNDFSRANGVTVVDGTGYMLAIYITRYPLIDDRAELGGNDIAYDYTGYQIDFPYATGEISKHTIYLSDQFNTETAGAIESVVQAAYAAVYTRRSNVFVTVVDPIEIVQEFPDVEGPSLGLGIYAAMANMPFGPLITGSLDRPINPWVSPRPQPIGSIPAKIDFALSQNIPIIMPYTVALLKVKGVATPMAISQMAVQADEEELPPVVYAIAELSELILAIWMGEKIGSQLRKGKGSAELEQAKAAKIKPDDPLISKGEAAVEAGFFEVDEGYSVATKVTQKRVDDLISNIQQMTDAGHEPNVFTLRKLGAIIQAQDNWLKARANTGKAGKKAPPPARKQTKAKPAPAKPKRAGGFDLEKLKRMRARLGEELGAG